MMTTIQKFQRALRERLDGRRVDDLPAGERQDQLGRQRQQRRLDDHGDEDAHVADGAVQLVQERDDELVDEGEHERPSRGGWRRPAAGRRDSAEDNRDKPSPPAAAILIDVSDTGSHRHLPDSQALRLPRAPRLGDRADRGGSVHRRRRGRGPGRGRRSAWATTRGPAWPRPGPWWSGSSPRARSSTASRPASGTWPRPSSIGGRLGAAPGEPAALPCRGRGRAAAARRGPGDAAAAGQHAGPGPLRLPAAAGRSPVRLPAPRHPPGRAVPGIRGRLRRSRAAGPPGSAPHRPGRSGGGRPRDPAAAEALETAGLEPLEAAGQGGAGAAQRHADDVRHRGAGRRRRRPPRRARPAWPRH